MLKYCSDIIGIFLILIEIPINIFASGFGSAGVSGYYKYDGITVRPVLNK